jgi:hypothetical protein
MKLCLFIINIVTATSTLLALGSRIAISQDGNYHDRDDISDVGLSCAILAKAGLKQNVVYWGTSDHYWLTNTSQEAAMQISVAGGAMRFGPFQNAQFFNTRASHAAAVNSLSSAINASSANNPLDILENGPAQVIGQAIQASHPDARKYVTVYSQSAWNDSHAETAGPSEGLKAPCYEYKDFTGMGVNVQHIQDQNLLLSTTKDKFYWLKNSSDPDLQWLYSRNEVAFPFPQTKFDCSGAGLVYYIATGDPKCTPTKLRSFLTQQ